MKKNYLLALFTIILLNVHSQTFSWANRGGLWAYDYGYGVVTDNSGNVYVTGKYELMADFNGIILPCNNCNHDAFLAKYTPSGAISWVVTAGGAMGDYAHGVACDGSYLYMVGEIEGAGDIVSFTGSSITLTAVADNDVFLTKYDLNGNLIWAKSAAGFDSEKGLAITYDNAGNVLICGHFRTSTTFGGTTTITGNGQQDIFVAKYDANGNFIWVRQAGGPGRDEPKSIKCDASGNIYVCGFYSNGAVFGSQTLTAPNGYYDAYLSKYDANGNLLWVTTAGGNYDEVAWSMDMDNAGLIYVAGEFNASAMFGSTQLITSGNADVFVACYNSSGNTLWAKKAGGPLIDRARGLDCDGNNLVITGQFGSTAMFGSNTLLAADSSDIFIASLDNSGNFISAISVAGQPDSLETLGYESGVAVHAEANGTVYATGGMLDGGIFGATVLQEFGRTDMFLTKVTQLISVNDLSSGKESHLFYPNPSNGNFTLQLDKRIDNKTETLVYNQLGEVIKKRTDESFTSINLDLSDQQSGIYLIELKREGGNTIREKIVIQK